MEADERESTPRELLSRQTRVFWFMAFNTAILLMLLVLERVDRYEKDRQISQLIAVQEAAAVHLQRLTDLACENMDAGSPVSDLNRVVPLGVDEAMMLDAIPGAGSGPRR